MFFGRAKHDWDHTSVMWALHANVNRDEKTRPEPYSPLEIHPYRKDIYSQTESQSSGFWSRISRLRAIDSVEGQLAALDSVMGRV
jgi:hypothetical protein